MGVILKKRKIKRLNCKQIDTNSIYDINFSNIIVSLYRTTNNTVDPLIPLDTRYLTKFLQLHVCRSTKNTANVSTLHRYHSCTTQIHMLTHLHTNKTLSLTGETDTAHMKPTHTDHK